MALSRIGNYRLQTPLGRSGLGKNYLALDLHTMRNVLVRVFPLDALAEPEAAARLRRALAAGAAKNVHIGEVYDAGRKRNYLYYVREFVPGLTLDKLPPSKRLGAGAVAQVGAQVAEALAAAHEAGVVHGGLKPANVVLTTDLRTKVLDFGVSDFGPGRATGGRVSRREEDFWLKSLPYMAPETLRPGKADPAGDLYSLGAVLYRLSTGRQPHDAPTAAALREAVLEETAPHLPASLPEADPELTDIINRLLDKEPRKRPRSAKEALDVLRSLRREPLTADVFKATAFADTKGILGPDECPAPEARAPGPESAEKAAAAPARHVNTWFESETPVPPLQIGKEYLFKLNIGPRRAGPASTSTPFHEPDFGGREWLDLLVSFFGEDFKFAARHHPLVLPRLDGTADVRTGVTPLRRGACRLEIVLSLARELEVLQKLEAVIEVVEDTPARVEA